MYRSPTFRTVNLAGDYWVMEGVSVLVTPLERYTGIGADAESPVMLLTHSVQTFSMSAPIAIVVVDLGGLVVRAGVVVPNRVLGFRRKRWVIEAQAGESLPAPGTRIFASTMPRRCQEH